MKTSVYRAIKSVSAITLLCCSFLVVADGFKLDMRDADIHEFIRTIGKLTQKTIIIDDRVKGKVDIQSHKALSQDELYEVFLTQLSVNGYAVVDSGNNILKVIPKQSAKLEGLEVGQIGSRAEQSEKLITRIVQVRDVNVDKLVATLRPLVDNKTGVIAAYSGSKVILITDRASNVRRIVKIINEIDRSETQTPELIKLKNASAPEVERMISKLIQKTGKGAAQNQPTIASDPRTNTLIIKADRETKRYLRSIITQLDGDIDSDANTRVIYLKYANTKEVSKVLQGISSAILKEEQQVSGSRKNQVKASNIHIESHEQTNAIVLSGSPHIITDLEKIIKKLDIRRAQVLVEAIIVELSEDKAKELGVQWMFYDASGSSTPVGVVNYTDSNSGIISVVNSLVNDTTPGLTTANGALLGIGHQSDNFSFAALLNALASDTKSNVLSTPSLLTMDNEEASILVGREVPVITGSTANDSNTNPFQTIERKDIGVKLQVKPQINDGDTVQLTIEQEVSSLTGLSASDIITNKRVVNTTVLVDNGATIVLGGLMDEDIQETFNKVPLLGDIPILGQAFSSEGTQKVKRNLMVFIRPTIMTDGESIARTSDDKYRYIRAEQIAKQKQGINLMPDEKITLLPELPQQKAVKQQETYQFPTN